MADRSPADRDTEASPVSVARTERIKLTAAYLNTAAGGLFTAGVVARSPQPYSGSPDPQADCPR